MSRWQAVWYPEVVKRSLDIVIVAIVLILAWPLLLVIWLALRMQGIKPVFAHQRVGRGGKLFACYKFSSMVPNAEQVLQQVLASDPDLMAEWQRDHKLRNDPRITPLGSLLRKSSLDELPQLWNVLKGDMSIVGPRPIVVQELARYGAATAEYFAVRPGVTGLWQISGRNEVSYDERVALDVRYAQEIGLRTDLRILAMTPWVILASKGAY
ncbi:sugar transferase [Burkholderiaceae bacterium DAT-1]|nr:sugar transferase [Burkholderiaceae bacterium DAT-1]